MDGARERRLALTQALAAMKVLIVDDNQHMRSIVRAVLDSAGIRQVREAGDGHHALMVLRNWRCDVALIDYRMAPMDGLELTKRLRDPATSPQPNLPIVMMTGYAERSSVIAARDAGVSEFIAKPVTAKAVLDRVHSALYQARAFVKTASYVGPSRRRTPVEGEPRLKRRAEDVQWIENVPDARKAG